MGLGEALGKGGPGHVTKDVLLRWLRVSCSGREIVMLIKGRKQSQKEGFLHY